MNSADTTKLMAYMASLWPSFKPTKETAAAWFSILNGQDPQRVTKAVQGYAINAESQFAPTPQEIFKSMRQAIRPERRIAGKFLALPGPMEPTLSEEEAKPWFAALHQHLAWVAGQHEAGTLDQAEVTARTAILKEAWGMVWQQKRGKGWVEKHEEKKL
jgi:hypothetical protein